MKIEDTSAQDTVLSPKSRSRLYIVLAVSAVAILVIGSLVAPYVSRFLSADRTVSFDRLTIATVMRNDLVHDIAVSGNIVAGVSPTLYAPHEGNVTYTIEVGDNVVADEIVAVIDSPELASLLTQEEKALSRLELDGEEQKLSARQKKLENQRQRDLALVDLTAARREAKRAEQAYAAEAISELDMQKATDELQSAELTFKHAEAFAELDIDRLEFNDRNTQVELEQQRLRVAEVRRQVGELSIRSPINGVVGTRFVDQKAWVASSQPVLSVIDLTEFEVETEVPENYADDLAAGMKAEITIGSKVHEAVLASISPEVIDNHVVARLRFDGSTPSGLRQRQRLSARIFLEVRPDVITVVRGSFLQSNGGRVAYVVSDGMATRRQIRTGAKSLRAVEITQGLQPGEQIVVSSNDIFRDAETVLLSP